MPAYYLDWLMGRIDAGYCLVANPFDSRRVTRVGLRPEDVDFLVLWTRDPRPLVRRAMELEDAGLRFYVQVTLVGYPEAVEPRAPPIGDVLDAMRELSSLIGPRRVVWRYDPIFAADGLGLGFHSSNFTRIAEALAGSVERVVVSLLDEYAGTAARLEAALGHRPVFGTPKRRGALPSEGRSQGPVPESQGSLPVPQSVLPVPYSEILSLIAAAARERDMEILACAEPYDLTGLGIGRRACVDALLAASIWGAAAGAAVTGAAGKDTGQRRACRCAPSIDIGAYGTCPRGCAYCYANRGRGRLRSVSPGDEAL